MYKSRHWSGYRIIKKGIVRVKGDSYKLPEEYLRLEGETVYVDFTDEMSITLWTCGKLGQRKFICYAQYIVRTA